MPLFEKELNDTLGNDSWKKLSFYADKMIAVHSINVVYATTRNISYLNEFN